MDKGNKSLYIVEEEIDNVSNENEVEAMHVAMKDDYDKDEKIALISYVRKCDFLCEKMW